MDTLNAVGTTSGIVSLVGIVCFWIYKCISHSNCHSRCCGHSLFDVDTNMEEKTIYLHPEKI